MKRALLAIAIIFTFFEGTYCLAVYTFQGQNLGVANIAIASATLNTIMATTSTTVGHLKWCYDCVANGGAGTMCESTGTTNSFQWVLSTGTRCK